MFDKMDTDRDGFLSKEELAAGHEKMLQKPEVAP
jgi:EF hand